MFNIREEIQDAISIPKPSLVNYTEKTHGYYKNTLKEYLNCKEVRVLSADQKDEIFGWTPTILFPEYEKYYLNLSDEDYPEKDYSGVQDGYGISEIFVVSQRYLVDADYLRHIRTTKDKFVVNVYGSDSALISKKFWEFTDHPEAREKFLRGQIPDYEFAAPPFEHYAAFGNAAYWDDVYIDSCQDAMAVLCIDLPYKYFSNQNLPGNIFTYDLGTGEYQVGNLTMKEANQMINEIAVKGFMDPLYFRINEGCLTPVDNETAIKLFLATYMNIPTIPAVLFMSNDEAVQNKGYEELHETVHSNIWHSQEALNLVNDILKPYFFFETAEDCRTKSYLQVGQFLMAKSQHPTMQNIEDVTVEIFDRYLDKSAPYEEVHVPLTEEENRIKMDNRVAQMMAELQQACDEDTRAYLEHLENTQYSVKN